MEDDDDNNEQQQQQSSAATSAITPPLPLPQSIPELEALIQRFYGLNTPQQYTQIDTCLKAVQKANGSFVLADQLMSSADPNVRFFGALTFTVKINRDWGSLTAAETKDLLHRLLFWFVQCVNGRDVSLVVRKLCSALVAFFKQAAGEWALCMRHAVACLVNGHVVEYDGMPNSQIQGLSEHQATACLWLGSALVEESSKLEAAGIESDKTIKAVSQNIPTLLDLVEHCLTSDTTPDHSLIQDAIKLVHTLRLSSLQLASEDDGSKQRLSNLVLTVVSRLAADELMPVIADLAMDIMDKDLDHPVTQLVATKLVQDQFLRYQKELVDGLFTDDSLIYGRLVVVTASTWIYDQANASTWKLPHLEEVLEKLILLAGTSGYPVEDDTLIHEVVEFWLSYVEWANDMCSCERKDDQQIKGWCVQSHDYTSRVLETLLGKMQMPPPEQFNRWDRQVQTEFRALRRDFRDFSAGAYTLLGTRMLETLVSYFLRLWAEQNWSGAEIALQCLKGVIEIAVDREDNDPALAAFINSPAFTNDEPLVPLSVRQVSIELLGDYSSFFERQAEPPMAILQWLFQCIDNRILSTSAAKTISSICDACRTKLSSNAPALVNLWCTLLVGGQQPGEVTERLAQAVGAVTQAFWAQSKHNPARASAIEAMDSLLQSLLQYIQTASTDNTPQGRGQRMIALQSLLNVARSFQQLEDEVIDLDGDGTNANQSDQQTRSWIASRQQGFVTVLAGLLQKNPEDGDLMEAICSLLRAGTTENLDNPFKFDEDLLVCLVKGYLAVTQRPQFLCGTVSRWLRSSQSWAKKDNGNAIQLRTNIAQACLTESLRYLETVSIARDDLSDHAEHIASVIDLMANYIPNDVSLFTSTQETAQAFFSTATTAIKCFTLPEPILKQSASSFWTKLLDLRPNPSTPETITTTLLLPLFPSLATTLTHALSGHAARSEIELIVLPFRRLVVFPIPRHPSGSSNSAISSDSSSSSLDAKSLLAAALFDPNFPSTRVSDSQKRMFLEKVLKLRGESAGTARVCREWWVACRGTFS